MPNKKWICLVCGIYVVALLLPAIAGAAVPDPTMLWWKFDEGTGTVAKDSSGKGHDGTITGAAWKSGGVGGTGYCLDFTALGQTVVNSDAGKSLNGLGAITIAMWVKSRVTGVDNGFINCETPGSGNDSFCTMRYDAAGGSFGGTSVLKMAVTSTPGGEQQLESSSNLQTTNWHHVAMTWKGGDLIRFYSNGKEDTPSGRNGPNNAGTISGCTTLVVGDGSKDYAGGPGAGWNGLIDDVRIYDSVLTAAQIAELAANKPMTLKATTPNPADGTVGVATPLLQWVKGDTAVFHNVYFGTTPDLTAANLVAPNQPFAMYFHVAGLQPGTKYYWRVDEVEADMKTIRTGDVWSFMSEPIKAYQPTPADSGAGLFPSPTLTWLPGKGAIKHEVYFSNSLADVNNATAAADKGKITETKFSTGVLRASTTYYWRVDEILLDGTVNKGPVWSFTTADGVSNKVVHEMWSNIGSATAVSALTSNAAYPNNPSYRELFDVFDGPIDFADNYGNRLYGWLKPPQSGDYTFWVSGDDETQLWLSTDADPANAKMIANVAGWTPAHDFDNTGGGAGGASQKSAKITLQAGQKYFIMALHKEGGGGDSVTAAWQGPGIAAREIIKGQYVDTFALPPLQAYSPTPANGAIDASQTGSLSWNGGDKAQKHDVYLGTDKAAVAAADTKSPLYQGQQAGTTFNPGALDWGKTYYWRVDEVNPAEAGSPWKGSVWSFTTANFILIDDFESYTDDKGNEIFSTWIDGWTNGTGSVVGNVVAPFAERTIVHGGKQSMPMDYNNTKTPFYSEAELDFSPLQNWAVNDVNALSLWVQGRPVAFVDKGNEAFTIGASGHDIWDAADDFRLVYKKLSGNGSVAVKVESLVNTNAWAKAGVMIRDNLSAGSPMAYMIQSFSSGVSFGWRLTTGATCGSATQAGIVAPQWVKLTRTGNAFTAQYSADGKTWKDIVDATGKPVSTTINMGASIYIGLCVTSHNAAATTTAELSGAATTGGVSGSWQQAWIGANADLTNSSVSLYVAVEDSTGKVAVASDQALVNATVWTQWKIPLSKFAGVNLAKIKKLYIGVGDRKSPVPDGTGRIYIDDIRVAKP